MLKIFKKISLKKFLLLFFFAICISVANIFVTSLISKSYRRAVEVLFAGEQELNNNVKIDRLLLYASSSYDSASFSCNTFSFLAMGSGEFSLKHVQVVRTSSVEPFRVLEILSGKGKDFSNSCNHPNRFHN